MRRAVLPAVLLLVGILAAPNAVAQGGHEHGSGGAGVLIQSDVPADGRAVVGGITHFAYVLVNDDGDPVPHRDVHVEVTLNGITLYRTESAHDYDGVGSLDVVFPTTGTYTVTVTAPGGNELTGTYSGYVVEPELVDAHIEVEVAEASTHTPTAFTVGIVDHAGNILPHTDALIEIRRVADDFPVLSFHGHIHNDPIQFTYNFEKDGPHALRVVAYTAFPSPDDIVFPVVVQTETIDVIQDAQNMAPAAPDPLSLLGLSVPAQPEPTTGVRNFLIADPATGTDAQVGPFGQVRASMITYNETDYQLIQHLNYEAKLTGPRGIIFESGSLHEYDGVLEIMSADQGVGTYTWAITTSGRAGEGTHSYQYSVLPAVTPFAAGPQFIDTKYNENELESGAPRNFELYAHAAAAPVPFMHSEVNVEIRGQDQMPLLIHKLHTHDTGLFAFEYAFPEGGSFVLQRDLFDIHGSATPLYYGATIDEAKGLLVDVAAGQPWTPGDVTVPAHGVDETATAAGLEVLLLVASLAGLVALRRR